MKYTKKIAALILTAFAVFSCLSFSVYAEEETESSKAESSETESTDVEYITSGDYSYSVATNDEGKTGAILEKYTGSDTEIELPDTIDELEVKALGDFTFYLNDKITEITIPKSIEEIGQFPFYGCTSLMEFKVDEQNEAFVTDSDSVLLTKDKLSIMSYPTGKNPEKYTVADGIQAIHSSAFAMCSKLKEISLPESLEYIDVFAFAECASLESISLPDSLTELQDFTFSGCKSLADVKLPENLTTIHDAVFFDCKALTAIDFPDSLYEIGQAAFCSTGITSITIPPTVEDIGYSAFGFHTDENDQIIADENFTVKGYNNSYAMTYCAENGVEFIPLNEPTEAAEPTTAYPNTNWVKKKIKPSIIIGICAVCAAALAVVVIVIVKTTKKSYVGENDVEDDGEDGGEDNYDEAEEEE